MVAAVVLLASAFACTRTAPPLAASRYDRSCANDEGCVLIHTGDPCRGGFGVCPGDAVISHRDEAGYEADLRGRPKCTEMVPPALYACPYKDASAVCVAGRCGVRGTSFEPDAGPTTRF